MRTLAKATRDVLAPWVIGVRPKTLTAVLVPILLGAMLGQREGFFSLSLLAFTVAAALLVQMGINLINDALDFQRGADTQERKGPTRLVQSGIKSAHEVLVGAIACYMLAILFSYPLIMKGGSLFIMVLIASLVFGYLYTGGRYPLAYRGLGDLFVLLFFGVIATCTSYYLQTETISFQSVYFGIQVGLLSTVMIVINNIRDIKEDREASKYTLAVRFGEAFCKKEIVICYLIAYFQLIYWFYIGEYMAACLPFCTAPLAYKLCRHLYTVQLSETYNILLAQAALIHLLFGLLTIVGCL